MPKRRRRLTPSEKLLRLEAKKRQEWREQYVEKRMSQVERENKARRKFNRQNAERIKAGKIRRKESIDIWDTSQLHKIESAFFAPQSRLLRFALDVKRPLSRGERSRDFNTRYIDKLHGRFVSRQYAKDLMDTMRAERQAVAISIQKNITFSEAVKWRQHLLDTKNLSYIIRIYGS